MEIYILLFISLILALATAYLGKSYQRLADKLKHLDSEHKSLHSRARHKASKLVEQARDQSLEIIEKSHQQASQILNQVSLFKDSTQADLGQGLKQVYERSLQDVRQQALDVMSQISSQIKEEAVLEIDELKKGLISQTQTSEKFLETQASNAFDDLKNELIKKQKELEDNTKKEIFETVKKTTFEIIGKTLTKKDHEDLVMQAFADISKKSKEIL